MKIGIFNPYFDDLGGGEKYMMTIAQCLSKKHDVNVFWDKEEDKKEFLDRFKIDLSNVHFVKNIFSPNVSFYKRFLETRKYDAIVVLSDGSIPYVLSKKLFLHFQQPMTHIKSISPKTRLKLSRINSIFCNSYFTKSFIDKAFGVNSGVIYPPVEIHFKNKKKENTILTVGRLRVKDVTVSGKAVGDYKKQSFMIDMFKRMVLEGLRGWRFIIAISVHAKDEKILEKMKEEAQDFPIDFLVNKSNRELWDIYNSTKIYWHAAGFGEDLDKHPEFAEHFGIATAEAMGAGAVPVAINAGGQKEIVEDGENGLLWDSEEQLKEKTLFLINNPKKMDEMAKKAQMKAKKFSKEHFCREIYELFEA